MDPAKHIAEKNRLVAYFSFPECSVCKSLRPKIKAVVQRFDGVEFIYIDTHQHPAIAGQHLVFAAPTVIYFENGREQKRWSRVFSVDDVSTTLQRA